MWFPDGQQNRYLIESMVFRIRKSRVEPFSILTSYVMDSIKINPSVHVHCTCTQELQAHLSKYLSQEKLPLNLKNVLKRRFFFFLVTSIYLGVIYTYTGNQQKSWFQVANKVGITVNTAMLPYYLTVLQITVPRLQNCLAWKIIILYGYQKDVLSLYMTIFFRFDLGK